MHYWRIRRGGGFGDLPVDKAPSLDRKLWTVAVLAYLAGFVDGEGCVGVYRRTNKSENRGSYYYPRLQVGNTDRRPLDWIAERFGGKVRSEKALKRLRPTHKTMYVWRPASVIQCQDICRAIRPYIIINKVDQVDVVLAFQLNERLVRYDTQERKIDVLDSRHKLYLATLRMNGRGVAASKRGDDIWVT
jgi:hypothetical protein